MFLYILSSQLKNEPKLKKKKILKKMRKTQIRYKYIIISSFYKLFEKIILRTKI